MEKNKHHDNCCSTDSNQVESKVLRQISQATVSNFYVSGMDCADEIAAIQKSLNHPKVAKVTANLMTSQVSVDHDPTFTKDEIIILINKAGVKVRESSKPLNFITEN